MNIAHGKVDGQDNGQTDDSDDENKNNQVALEPDVLYGVDPTLPEDHVILQGEDTQDPGTHSSVNFRELSTNYGVRVILQVTNETSWN